MPPYIDADTLIIYTLAHTDNHMQDSFKRAHANKHGHARRNAPGKANINEDGKTSEHGSRERARDEEY